MSRSKPFSLDEVLRDPLAFFAVAKSEGDQQVPDAEGVFTLSYRKTDAKPDAREFLAKGGSRN
jgi:hypothetical protein